METFFTIIVWLLFGLLSANYARYRGRDPYLWFFIGMFMGIFALLILFLLPVSEAEQQQQEELQEDDPALIQMPIAPVLPHEFQTRDWYYLTPQNQQEGPVAFDILKKLWMDGTINSTSLVWSEGMEQWNNIQELPPLQELLSS